MKAIDDEGFGSPTPQDRETAMRRARCVLAFVALFCAITSLAACYAQSEPPRVELLPAAPTERDEMERRKLAEDSWKRSLR